MSIKNLLRPNIRDLKPYSCARSEYQGARRVSLDANENPYGSKMELNRYPDPLQTELRSKVASALSVKEDQIFLGNGSDEAIDLLIRAFIEPKKDSVVICPPTYGMYKVLTEIQGGKIVEVPLKEDFGLDLKGLMSLSKRKPKLLIFPSPNNPTGASYPKKDIEAVADTFPGIVAVDEAYIDFYDGESAVDLVAKYPSLCVLRTFSKAFGLAGIRLGILAGDPELVSVLNKIKQPYNVNKLTAKKAEYALRNLSTIKRRVKKIVLERDRIANELSELCSVEQVFPSSGNFLLVRVKNAKQITDKLKRSGIIVRDRSAEPACKNCIRITVGTFSENQTLLSEFRRFK